MLQNYRNQIEAKRKLEAEFRPKQELFGIEPANYKELEWVEQEIEKLTMVWDIRDGWNKEWDKLRSGSFQSLKLVLNCHKLFIQMPQGEIKGRTGQGVKDQSSLPLIFNTQKPCFLDVFCCGSTHLGAINHGGVANMKRMGLRCGHLTS